MNVDEGFVFEVEAGKDIAVDILLLLVVAKINPLLHVN